MEKIKARSRLKKPRPSAPSRLARLNTPKTAPAKPLKPSKDQRTAVITLPMVRLQAYWRYLICLVIASIAYYGLFLLVNQVYPSQIQHFLWTNSYLPFFVLLFLGNFFLLTFLFLNKKIGFYLALWLNLAVYLKISQVELDFYGVGFLVLVAMTLFLLVKYKKFPIKHF
jgi:hypothetical protein